MPRSRLAALGLGLFILGLSARQDAAAPPREDSLSFVPWPKSVTRYTGQMTLTDASRIVTRNKELRPLARILANEVGLVCGLRLAVEDADPRPGDIHLVLAKELQKEAYRLTIDTRASVTGGDYNGVALGTATLLQAVRAEGGKVSLPRLSVEDRSHFAYCGAMLDVARKPHSLDTLRQCVRVCRFYKIRYLHLHLSDENAWVFPSKAFPKLGSQNFAWAGGVKPAVYYRAELKALVAFADARGVTLVPEIEMPGHSGQLRGTMPSVFGYRDAKGKAVTLGVLNMVSEEAFATLDTIVGEVCEVFASSPYIHIGGDETSLGGVEAMPEVKSFMARHKLASTHAVFNAFVNRMHGIVKKRGKRTIVWEGAPLDPAAPSKDLILMPWVGGSGAVADYVKRGYAVINPPWGTKALYIDPHLVNGAQLKKGEPLLLGATSILWESVEEATVPYLRSTVALRNEPTWNPDAARGHADFLHRLRRIDPLLDRLLYGFTFRPEGTLDPLVFMRPDTLFSRRLVLILEASKTGRVRYTLDGTEPTARSPAIAGPLELSQTTTVRARWFGTGKETMPTFSRTYRLVPNVRHDAVGARVTVVPGHSGYPGPGPRGLTDGFLADGDESGSAGWVGLESGSKIDLRIDLGRPKRITSIGEHFLRAGGGIAPPKSVEFAVSDDGKTYHKVAIVGEKIGAARRGWYVASIEPATARYVRMLPTPDGDWTFLDEVAVNPRLPAPTFRHAALGKPVTLAHAPAEFYSKPGTAGLTDGHRSRSADCLNLEWLGVEGKNFDATIDMGSATEVRRVGARFMQQVRVGVRIPQRMEVLVSDDGKMFRKIATVTHEQTDTPAYIRPLVAEVKGVKARFVRIVGHTNGQWLFADEVFVNPETDRPLDP